MAKPVKPWPKYTCQFKGCPITNKNKVPMHNFPKSEERCKQWMKACGKESLKNVTLSRQWYNAKLCGRHFADWCFLDWSDKKRLVRNAVPCTAEKPILDPVRPPSIKGSVKLATLHKTNEVKEQASELNDAGTIKFGHERLECKNLGEEMYREQSWTSIKSKKLKENLINDGISEELVDFIICRMKLRKTERQRKIYKIEGRQFLYTICKDKTAYILPD